MKFHWQITLMYVSGSLAIYKSRDGLVTARPGETRQKLVNRVTEQAKTKVGAPDDAVVLFFSLDPNELVPVQDPFISDEETA